MIIDLRKFEIAEKLPPGEEICVVIQRVIKSSPEGTRLYYELNYVLIPRLLIGTSIYYRFVLLQG